MLAATVPSVRMTRTPQQELTQVLIDASEGDDRANELLWSTVYAELRRIAHRQLVRERDGHTMSTTGLVHETYLRMIDQAAAIEWQNRSHFYAVAARAMRRILIDYARKRNAQKRGGGQANLTLEEALVAGESKLEELIALDDALDRLGQLNERLVRVVECRYFGGLTEAETADTLGISVRTVQRDWVIAKAFLHDALYGTPDAS